MSNLPTVHQVLELPAAFDQVVDEKAIDVNGHMNIGDYFRLASWAPWLRLEALGVGEEYIAGRQSSFFTVEHHIRYLAELRLGERFSVHAGFGGRTDKAVHAVAFVVDRERDRLACVMEIVYVHVSTTERRATVIPDDIVGALDDEMAAYGDGWLGRQPALPLRG